MNRKIVISICCLMMTVINTATILAQGSIEKNGINYYLSPEYKEATVIAKDGGYKGTINIPSKLTIDYEPYTVTGIASDAFKDCEKLTEVIIPSTIGMIQENAFVNVPKGLNIYINTSEVIGFVKSNSFDASCFTNATLYLPTESILKEYLKRDPWSKFTKTGIVPKSKSDGVDRRSRIEKSRSRRNSSKSNVIVF